MIAGRWWSTGYRILGLDPVIERYDVGGQRLLERYPLLDDVLG